MKRPRCGAWLALALVGALSWGCASGGSNSAGGATRESGRCTSDLAPSEESLAPVLDSVAVQDGLEVLWPAGGGLAVARLAALDSDGPRPVQVWSESLTAEQRDAVATVLGENRRTPDDGDGAAYLFLGDAGGPALRRVERLGQCAPTIISREPITRRIAAEIRQLGIDQRYVVRLYVFVQASGQVGEVRVAESSGDVQVDLAAARVFRGERLAPGMIEGMRVPIWVAFPVTFTPRR